MRKIYRREKEDIRGIKCEEKTAAGVGGRKEMKWERETDGRLERGGRDKERDRKIKLKF